MAQSKIRIKTVINSQYQVFDKSSCIPFSIAFGLCRLPSAASPDEDPRPIQVLTSGSILDLPYALSKGLLTFRVRDIETNDYRDLGPGELDFSASNEQSHVILPSPVGREKKWKNALVVHRYSIDPGSDFGRSLEVGKRYAIRVKSGGDLGFKDWKYLDSDGSNHKNQDAEISEYSSTRPRLVAGRADGFAVFRPVPSVPMPPRLHTVMRRCKEHQDDGSVCFRVETLNLGPHPIVVQTRGQQRFLKPRGPILPESGVPGLDGRARIIDANNPSAFPTFRVLDFATNDVVREASKPGTRAPMVRHDPRPRLETLVTLKPDEPLVRHADLSSMLSKLPDGRFEFQMEPRGMWWCEGSVEDFAAEGEDRVPQRCWTAATPPVVLECQDLAEIHVENGLAKE